MTGVVVPDGWIAKHTTQLVDAIVTTIQEKTVFEIGSSDLLIELINQIVNRLIEVEKPVIQLSDLHIDFGAGYKTFNNVLDLFKSF